MSGSLVHWFSEFADEVGPTNVRLIMLSTKRFKRTKSRSYHYRFGKKMMVGF